MTKVLVIDDEMAIREVIAHTLRKASYEVFTATNGAEGLELARKQLPGLIICDVRMVLVDGYEVLSAIRNNPSTASIPFIMVTSMASVERMRQGMELGADDFLPKPFTPSQLLGAVKARLEKHRLLVQEAESKLELLRQHLSTALPHELRTPLNGILGYADILRKQFNDLEPREVSQMAERIYKNGKRLNRLVENFLIYAQIEIIKMDYQKIEQLRKNRSPDAQKIIDTAACQRAYESERAGDLILKLEPGAVAMSPEYFSKTFEEIFDNAIRYSKKGSPLVVETGVSNGEYVLTVRDHGRGMSAEQIHGIGAYMQFERKVYEQQGSGLGLTVAKRLTEIHGGYLRLDSDYGKGTTVTVTIPSARDEELQSSDTVQRGD
ncbi:MAG TPA: hybrid sensor histidine kinase/response regulator [Bacteroidota bacterium]|nr:hybrid sensor histidine kinase/response regulator [Bacteroidota bacterium]